MKKLLIIGCSYSLGSWELDTDKKTEILPRNSLGWYNFVDWIKDFETTVIATQGQGYSSWVQLLYYFNRTGYLNEFDNIMIQETHEPRTTLLSQKYVQEVTNFLMKHHFPIKKIRYEYLQKTNHIKLLWLRWPIIYSASYLTGATILKDKRNGYAGETWGVSPEFRQELIDSTVSYIHDMISGWSSDYIQTICRRNNLKGLIWSMGKVFKDVQNDYLTRLTLETEGDETIKYLHKNGLTVDNNNKYSNQVLHPTLDGNKKISELINKAICQ